MKRRETTILFAGIGIGVVITGIVALLLAGGVLNPQPTAAPAPTELAIAWTPTTIPATTTPAATPTALPTLTPPPKPTATHTPTPTVSPTVIESPTQAPTEKCYGGTPDNFWVEVGGKCWFVGGKEQPGDVPKALGTCDPLPACGWSGSVEEIPEGFRPPFEWWEPLRKAAGPCEEVWIPGETGPLPAYISCVPGIERGDTHLACKLIGQDWHLAFEYNGEDAYWVQEYFGDQVSFSGLEWALENPEAPQNVRGLFAEQPSGVYIIKALEVNGVQIWPTDEDIPLRYGMLCADTMGPKVLQGFTGLSDIRPFGDGAAASWFVLLDCFESDNQEDCRGFPTIFMGEGCRSSEAEGCPVFEEFLKDLEETLKFPEMAALQWELSCADKEYGWYELHRLWDGGGNLLWPTREWLEEYGIFCVDWQGTKTLTKFAEVGNIEVGDGWLRFTLYSSCDSFIKEDCGLRVRYEGERPEDLVVILHKLGWPAIQNYQWELSCPEKPFDRESEYGFHRLWDGEGNLLWPAPKPTPVPKPAATPAPPPTIIEPEPWKLYYLEYPISGLSVETGDLLIGAYGGKVPLALCSEGDPAAIKSALAAAKAQREDTVRVWIWKGFAHTIEYLDRVIVWAACSDWRPPEG